MRLMWGYSLSFVLAFKKDTTATALLEEAVFRLLKDNKKL
jgi:hypothetical protein